MLLHFVYVCSPYETAEATPPRCCTVVLAARFINIERVTRPKFPKFNTALPSVLSYKPATAEVDQTNSSQDTRTTY